MAADTTARTHVFLTGTPAQVAWARSVRYRLLPLVDELRDVAADHLRCGRLSARSAEGFVLAIEGAANVTAEHSAAWWIEHRGARAETLIADHAASSTSQACLICRGLRARGAARKAVR